MTTNPKTPNFLDTRNVEATEVARPESAGLAQVLTLHRIKRPHAVDACSQIGYLITGTTLTGLAALMLERAMLTDLYLAFLAEHASGEALQYVATRRYNVIYDIEQLKCSFPDLFEQPDKKHVAGVIDQARREGVIRDPHIDQRFGETR